MVELTPGGRKTQASVNKQETGSRTDAAGEMIIADATDVPHHKNNLTVKGSLCASVYSNADSHMQVNNPTAAGLTGM